MGNAACILSTKAMDFSMLSITDCCPDARGEIIQFTPQQRLYLRPLPQAGQFLSGVRGAIYF